MNENKFTGMSDGYAKHRPTYPQTFIDYLYSDIGFNEKSVVADIGSGTGIFTELLVKKGSSVFAVEPNYDMRSTAEQYLGGYAGFVSVSGSAENTSLKKASCDFVTVAQAFHWFDALRFKEECRRILKPDGKVVIIYNNRISNSLVSEHGEVNRRFCPDFKGFSGGMAMATHEAFKDFFEAGICEMARFKNNLAYDEESFVGRCMSASYALKESSANFDLYLSALKNLFAKHSLNGLLYLPTETVCFVGRV